MQTVAILNKAAAGNKPLFDFIHVRTEILSTPEIERDWENIVRRFGSYGSEDMKEIGTKAECGNVIKIWSVSDRVLDAMYTLGEEDHKVSKSALRWAIDQLPYKDKDFPEEPSDRVFIRHWIEDMANHLCVTINPNFTGYVSHRDEDYVLNGIVNEIRMSEMTELPRPTIGEILTKWLDGDWAPIYMN